MAEEEDISPEEKLLKVIQNPESASASKDDAAEPAAAEPVVAEPAAEVPSAPEEPKVAEAPKPAEEPDPSKLKVGKKKSGKSAKFGDTKIGEGVEVPAAGSSKIGVGAQIVDERKGPTVRLGMKAVNRLLAVAAMVMLCIIGLDAATYQTEIGKFDGLDPEAVFQQDVKVASITDVNSAGLVSKDQVIAAYKGRPVIRDIEVIRKPPPKPDPEGPIVAPVQTAWQKYAKENLKLVMRSRLPDNSYKMTVQDKKSMKLYFLKAGDKFALNGQAIEVSMVGARFLKLTDGTAELSIE